MLKKTITVLGLTAFGIIGLNDSVSDGDNQVHSQVDNYKQGKALDFIINNSSIINESAENYSLSRYFLASLIYNEHQKHDLLEESLENIAIIAGRNPSVGNIEMKISTIAVLDGKKYENLTTNEKLHYRQVLKDPKENIIYVAKLLDYISSKYYLDLDEPNDLALLATKYISGEYKKQVNEPAKDVLYTMLIMTDNKNVVKANLLMHHFNKIDFSRQDILNYLQNN